MNALILWIQAKSAKIPTIIAAIIVAITATTIA